MRLVSRALTTPPFPSLQMIGQTTRPPRGAIPTIKKIVEMCPWDTRQADDADRHARRIGAQLQARAYLLWMIGEHPPRLTVAHGIAETFWSRDGALLEDIAVGYARWSLGTPDSACRSFRTALRTINAEAGLDGPLMLRVNRAWEGRNNAMHGNRAVPMRSDYRRLTPRGIQRMIDVELPIELMRVLRARDTNRRLPTP